MSRIQKNVTLSTTKAEYAAVTKANKKLIWLQGLLTELRFIYDKCELYNNRQSVIHLTNIQHFIQEQNTLVFVITSLYLFLRMRC